MARLHKTSLLYGFSGSISKQLVYRQYAGGTIVSAYPDMSRVIFSERQKEEQGLFALAVAFARSVIKDPVKKKEFAKRLPKGARVYNGAIKEFLAQHRKQAEK